MEPPLPEDYPLLSAPHTVLTPHVGFDTEEAMERRAAIVADNLKSFVEGKQKISYADIKQKSLSGE